MAIRAGSAPVSGTTPEDDTAVFDDDAPEWPDEAVEASMVSDQRERGETPAVDAGGQAEEEEEDVSPTQLPGLDELIGRLSPKARETLDELFRAKFMKVVKTPKRALIKR